MMVSKVKLYGMAIILAIISSTCCLIIYPLFLSQIATETSEECTIGVAAGSATCDGRPMIWKTRDYSDRPNNEVYYNTSYAYKFISVVNAGGSYSWMGLNEHGFAIVNSQSSDLVAGSIGLGNGSLQRYALGSCATMEDFEALLDSTNATGRQTRANFAVIDANGAAAIFETGGYFYWKFDANNRSVAPNGYILRTNFAVNGGGNSGMERYRRTTQLVADFYAESNFNHKSILRTQMRDFSDANSDLVPVPYPQQWISDRPFGYIYTGYSICRWSSVSAAVIRGVLPDEPARLSTMWVILGQPASSIALPYWPVGATPPEADGPQSAPICDVANLIKSLLFDYTENERYIDSYKLRDAIGKGLWARTFIAEDSILAATEILLDQWRIQTPTSAEMLAAEFALADYTLSVLEKSYENLAGAVPDRRQVDFILRQNYPNPFNETTTIEFDLLRSCRVRVVIYNVLGQEVAFLLDDTRQTGRNTIIWEAKNLASGVYIIRLIGENSVSTRKALLLK